MARIKYVTTPSFPKVDDMTSWIRGRQFTALNKADSRTVSISTGASWAPWRHVIVLFSGCITVKEHRAVRNCEGSETLLVSWEVSLSQFYECWSKMKDSLIFNSCTKIRVSAFLPWFPKSQFPQVIWRGSGDTCICSGLHCRTRTLSLGLFSQNESFIMGC